MTNGEAKTLLIKGTAIGLNYAIVGTTCASTLAAGQSCDYQVTFNPGSAGTKSTWFKLTNNLCSTLKVQLTGVGQ